MHNSIIRLDDLQSTEIFEIATDETAVWRYNQEYGTEGLGSFVFLRDGEVYGCDYAEPCSFDKLYKVR